MREWGEGHPRWGAARVAERAIQGTTCAAQRAPRAQAGGQVGFKKSLRSCGHVQRCEDVANSSAIQVQPCTEAGPAPWTLGSATCRG